MSGQRGILTVFTSSLVLGLLTSAPARAAEGEFMRDAMSSIGLIEPERPPITYRERAPLVMPPALGAHPSAKKHQKGKALDTTSADPTLPLPLPTPQARQADPAWPKDPEVTQRERARSEANKPIVRGAQGRMNDNNETLSAAEMNSGRRAGAGLSSDPAPRPGEARDSSWFDPLALFGGKKDELQPSTVEPDRDGLTDPPNGYRKAPIKTVKTQNGPMGGSISGNEEADPRAYMREQSKQGGY
ncbi:hypothetical protein [Methylobacterium brachythecii]|uniref:DUF3035 domain-containing protein n=1 Tax=Methylobacterium brachythecii TaxID=1176177 RepID=A0A7W6F4Q6_9HYPH|nr:hypothetical protein [Methylobacterium brachythecii]MBB3900650.1 hypothetical protein [Methylobacterium brachythecii]GLS43527.1 hypothetical protein GCM10007884_15120 [Methylobacterium brachythecii]